MRLQGRRTCSREAARFGPQGAFDLHRSLPGHDDRCCCVLVRLGPRRSRLEACPRLTSSVRFNQPTSCHSKFNPLRVFSETLVVQTTCTREATSAHETWRRRDAKVLQKASSCGLAVPSRDTAHNCLLWHLVRPKLRAGESARCHWSLPHTEASCACASDSAHSSAAGSFEGVRQ